MSRRIGILTGGGDAPGLNAVIRAVVKYAVGERGWELIGIEDAFNGLLESPRRITRLTVGNSRGLLHRGGTVLGTTNRGDPFSFPTGPAKDAPRVDRSAELAAAVHELGIEGLIVIGGDGTQRIAHRLMVERGVPVLGVPKTIDNDLASTDLTFGFWSAVQVATDALDRLHTTAEAHDRVMLLEVMGRDAGWIALYAGMTGGADCIALPELPYDVDRFVASIQGRHRHKRNFTLIVVAEGATPKGEPGGVGHPIVAGGAAATLRHLLESRIDAEVRVTVLGHLQRGGTPIAFDRLLATRFGVHAVDLIDQGRWGEMVGVIGTEIVGIPLENCAAPPRLVGAAEPLLHTARAIGIELGG